MPPRLPDVPGFSGILIHRGNTKSDSSGCILVGENKEKGKVINSTQCEKKLVEILTEAQERGEEIKIEVINKNFKKADPLNSRTKKLHIELPDYSFSHSHTHFKFLGRAKLVERLSELITRTSTHKGVYLIAGDRGVGKTSLVEKVIENTSLSKQYPPSWAKFLLALLCIVLILQVVLLQIDDAVKWNCWTIIVLSLSIIVSFFMLGTYSSYKRRKRRYQKIHWLKAIWRIVRASFKEFLFIKKIEKSFGRQLYFLKMTVIVCVILFCSGITCIPPVKLFIVYSVLFLAHRFKKYTDYIIYSKKDIKKRGGAYVIDAIFYLSAFCLLIVESSCKISYFWSIIGIVLLLCVGVGVCAGIKIFFCIKSTSKKKTSYPDFPSYDDIKNYIKHHLFRYMRIYSRIYIKINFGQEGQSKRDILRLIARSLQTSYNNYCFSFKHTFFWKIVSVGILLLFTFLFHDLIYTKSLLPQISHQPWYQQSSQSLLKNNTVQYKNNSLPLSDSAFSAKTTVQYDLALADTRDTLTYHIRLTKTREQTQEWQAGRIESAWLVTDSVINNVYQRIRNAPRFFGTMTLEKERKGQFVDNEYTPVNYAFWLIFACLFLLGRLICRISTIVTPRKVKRQLKNLNDNITYGMELDRGQYIGISKGFFNVSGVRNVRKSRGIADEGEIEMELQAIFTAMQQIPLIMCRPEWIIVFDELDKLEQKNINDDNKQTKDSLLAIHSREKQVAVLKLLSDLKYFLSTSTAQFVFIAGREMYDIYLADISERSNLLGSIFNDVLFVPGFLSEYEEEDISDMTSMVEQYVCMHIIPEFYTKFEKNLQGYKKYLDEVIYKEKYHAIAGNSDVIELEKQKIIACLQQFIIYLAYASKGAPKKMVQIFESYIQTYFTGDLDEYEDTHDNCITVKLYRNSRFFLTFDYYAQFMLGMTSYLVAPVMYRFSDSNIQKHSDKLLVASLRFIDFLFKFHQHNFSWKSLDISPELIEVNRAPELRSLAGNLVNYLVRIHIDRSYSGFYEFRFENLISQEILFMSKVCEQFSAMFNFSLDESLALKYYYNRLLEKAKERAQDHNMQHSIASLQIVLGDLYFYDDELEEASTYYKDGIQSLPRKKELFTGEASQLHHIYFYIRNMLKLGFVYEKRKQYDFAFLTYSDLCNDIMDMGDKSNRYFQDMRLMYLPLLAKLQILEKCHTGGIRQKDLERTKCDFDRLVCGMKVDEANILKAIFYSRIGDILYYKNRNFDLKNSNTARNSPCTACRYYQKALSILVKQEDSKVSLTELLGKVWSDIAKNMDVKYYSIMAQILSNWGNVFFACDGCKCECSSVYKKQIINTENKIIDFWKPWYECIFGEHKNFEELLAIEHYSKMKLALIMYALAEKHYKKANDYKRSAYQITKILQVFRLYVEDIKINITIDDKEYNEFDVIKALSQRAIRSIYIAYEETTILELNKRRKDFDKTPTETIPLQEILIDSEIKRIIIVVKSLELKLYKIMYKDNREEMIKKLKTYYALNIVSPYGINYSVSARIYRLSLKSTLNWETYQAILKELNIPQDEDIKNENNKYTKLLCLLSKISENTQHVTVIDEIFNDYYPETGNRLYLKVFEKLIAETIFCFKEIIRLSKTVGETYLFNHSMRGDMYYYLKEWTRLLEAYLILKELTKDDDVNKNHERYIRYNNIKLNEAFKQIEDIGTQKKDILQKFHNYLKDSSIEDYMKDYLGEEWRENISGYYDNHNALAHYYKCKETHEEGKTYLDMIDNMFYLREDFNDRSDHFYVAVERHFILSGKIDHNIKQLKKRYAESKLHEVDNYFR
jgi:hypothetical protein